MDNAATYSRPPCTSKHCTESMHVHMLYAHMPAAACMVRPAGRPAILQINEVLLRHVKLYGFLCGIYTMHASIMLKAVQCHQAFLPAEISSDSEDEHTSSVSATRESTESSEAQQKLLIRNE